MKPGRWRLDRATLCSGLSLLLIALALLGVGQCDSERRGQRSERPGAVQFEARKGGSATGRCWQAWKRDGDQRIPLVRCA